MAVSLASYKATPVITWNASNRTYSTGKNVLSQAEVRGFVDAAIKQARNEARAIAEAFLEHGNSAELITSLKDLIRNENLAVSMIANGGREQMTQSIYGRVGNIIKDQYAYAEHLGRQIDNGEITNLGEGFLSRVESYANQGLLTYEGFLRDGMASIGMYAVNELGGSVQSCQECPDLSAQGPMPADEMTPIGMRECGPGCNCEITYITAEEAAGYSD